MFGPSASLTSVLFWERLDDIAVEITSAEGKLLRARASQVDENVAEMIRAVSDLIEHVTENFPVEDRDGYREEDARTLIDECDELAKRGEDVVQLVRTVADNPEAFPLLSVSRKRLAQSIQQLREHAARERLCESPASPTVLRTPSTVAVHQPVAPVPKPLPVPAGKPLPQRPSQPAPKNPLSSSESLVASGNVSASSGFLSMIRKSATDVPSARSIFRSDGGSASSPEVLTPVVSFSPREGRSATVRRQSSVLHDSFNAVDSTMQSSVEMEQVAARFYHVGFYDRPRQRIIVHGGLRRDKPSRLCAPSVFLLELHELQTADDAVWYDLEVEGDKAPALCWHAGTLLDLNHWMVFGGKTLKNEMSNTGYVLDLVTNQWSVMFNQGSVPEPRAGHTLIRMPDQDESLLFGGIDSSGTRCYNDVYVLNHQSQTWRAQPTSNAPVGRFAHSMVLVQNTMWLFGGLRGSLQKSVPGADLWCLNLTTWEWYQPSQSGPMPDSGTYTLAALEGESGSEVVCIGGKPMDEYRDSFYVFEMVDTGVASKWSVVWRKGAYPKQNRPATTEGHTIFVAGQHVYVVGGRPGDTKSTFIDLVMLPKTSFASHERELLQRNLSQARLNNVVGSVSGGSSGRALAASTSRAGTPVVGNTASRKMLNLYLGGSKGPTSPTTSMAKEKPKAAPPPLDDVASPRSPTMETQVMSLKAENADLREKLANLQLNFEMELSRRLDSESKAQASAQNYKILREAYDTLQVETQRLFQLALSEVTSAPAAQEKLQRRYEELRSASQVAEGPRSTEGGVVNAKDSAVNDKHTTVRSGRRKEEQTTAHKQSVEAVNSVLNKLLQSIAPAVTATLNSRSSLVVSAPLAEIETISSCWKNQESLEKFRAFVEPYGKSSDVQFCRAVYRLLNAPEDARATLAESVLVEHIDDDANFAVTSLSSEQRAAVRAQSQEAPESMELWEQTLQLVEGKLDSLFKTFQSEVASGRRNTLSTPQHQILLSAESQLREKLAEMESSEADGDENEQDTFLFKKVTSEMVATEINYVTDLKVITTIFRRPLLDEKSSILPLEAFNIFANIEDVYAMNRKFLTALQKEHGKPIGSKNYGRVFLEYATQLKKVYLVYASRKTISRNTLDQLAASNRKFVGFLEECLQKPPCRRLELKSFLIKPVQRICKYPLLLRTMVESCPREYADKAGLVEAKKKMEEVVSALEDQLFVEDEKLRLLELEGALNWHREPKLVLSVPERMLLYHGVLIGTEIQVGRGGFDDVIALKNLRNFHVYLCSDMLLVVEEREKKGQRRDYLQHVVGLAYAAVIPVAGKPAFQILQPRQDFKYLFRAANSEAKGVWMSKITDQILDIRARLKIGESALTGSGTGAGLASAAQQQLQQQQQQQPQQQHSNAAATAAPLTVPSASAVAPTAADAK